MMVVLRCFSVFHFHQLSRQFNKIGQQIAEQAGKLLWHNLLNKIKKSIDL